MKYEVGDIVIVAGKAIGAPSDQQGEVIGIQARKVRVEIWIDRLETYRVFTVWPKDLSEPYRPYTPSIDDVINGVIGRAVLDPEFNEGGR